MDNVRGGCFAKMAWAAFGEPLMTGMRLQLFPKHETSARVFVACASELAPISGSAGWLGHMRTFFCCSPVFAQHWAMLNGNLKRTGQKQHACGRKKIRSVRPSFPSAALSSSILHEQASTSRSLCHGSSLAPGWALFCESFLDRAFSSTERPQQWRGRKMPLAAKDRQRKRYQSALCLDTAAISPGDLGYDRSALARSLMPEEK